MDINYEKLKKALAKTMVETRASEDSLFAMCYDLFAGSAPTFSSRNPRKRRSCASRQLPPRTYYLKYDKNLIDELFKSQDSYTFSGYSYDAPTYTNFDEIDYYNPYFNMKRLYENIDRIIGIEMTYQKHIANFFLGEKRMQMVEELNFDANEVKLNDDVFKAEEGDPGGSEVVWYNQFTSCYTTPNGYIYKIPDDEKGKILIVSRALDVNRNNTSEGI